MALATVYTDFLDVLVALFYIFYNDGTKKKFTSQTLIRRGHFRPKALP